MALLLGACATRPVDPPNLDQLLRFAVPAHCEEGKTLSTVLENMVGGPSDDGLPVVGRLLVPRRYRNAVGQPRFLKRVTDPGGDWSLFEVPLRGRWMGLPVKAVQQYVGHENGIGGFAILFDAPRDLVWEGLDRAGFQPPRDGDRIVDADGFVTMSFGVNEGELSLICDHSN